MQLQIFPTLLLVSIVALVSSADDAKKTPPTKLQIGITKRVQGCGEDATKIKSRKGDTLHMQYRGTLHETDEEFDSSYSRNTPFVFVLGEGQVIRGWDQGLLGMCEGEERKVIVPADMGYGKNGAPPKIPANAALVFKVKLDKIERHGGDL